MPPLSLTPVNNDIFDRVSAINRPNNYVDSETQTIDNMAVPNLKLSPTITSKSLSSTKEIAAPDNINGSKIVRSLSSKLKKVITGESRGNFRLNQGKILVIVSDQHLVSFVMGLQETQ